VSWSGRSSVRSGSLAVLLVAGLSAACNRGGSGPSASGGGGGGDTVARWAGGTITRAEFDKEAARLPPLLRQQVATPFGRKEFVESMVDKRLLVEEALRRGLAEEADIKQKVDELRDRLVVQALLARAEKAQAAPTEAELRHWYDANKSEVAEPEKVRLGRLLITVTPASTEAQKKQAKEKAERLQRRLRAGATLAQVAPEGDGPEKKTEGVWGLFAKGDLYGLVESAAFKLDKPGAVTEPIFGPDGYTVAVLLEKIPGRVPPFEEVREKVRGRVEPVRKRKVFDDLRAELRKQGAVHVDEAALK
jgi:peptidyl-prolyl cis-trans isomerase C